MQPRTPRFRSAALLVSLLLLALFWVAEARAATTRTVTTLADTVDANDGLRSLREAISASVSGDTINFSVTGTITLAGELSIQRALTITGPGARKLTISGNDASRIFNIQASAPVSLSGLALIRGRAPVEGGSQLNYRSSLGGAIYNSYNAPLTLTGCAVTSSLAQGEGGAAAKRGGSGSGGAIFSRSSLTLRNCLVSGNRALGGTGNGGSGSGVGGGIDNSTPTTMVNTTVANNIAGNNAGGVFSASYVGVDSLLVACTISGNQVTGSGATYESGGLCVFADPVILRDTLVAGNTAASQPNDEDGVFISQGHNLIGARDPDTSWQPTDLTGTPQAPLDPQLGPLQNNSGPTDTFALQPTSAALDAGDDTVQNAPDSVTTDQRGLPRRLGARVDIGAYERDAPQSGPGFQVNSLEDPGDGIPGGAECTLREALAAANEQNDSNTVTFVVGLTGVITLSSASGPLTLANPVTVTGPGARVLAVSGGGFARVFEISANGVNVSGLTLRDGLSAGVGGSPAGDGFGGGILNRGTLALTACALVRNSAWGGGALGNSSTAGNGLGGGVYSSGILTMSSCTLSNNEAQGGDVVSGTGAGVGFGGGLYLAGGTATLINCTFSFNLAKGRAGEGGGIYNADVVTLTHCTIAGNEAVGGDGSIGGGLYHFDGFAYVRNTVVALNTVTVGATTRPEDAPGNFSSNGANLIGAIDAYSNGWTATDKTGTPAVPLDPKLASLANNGGPTDTCAVLSGSPAVNGANNSFAPATDQRGLKRLDAADIGAFESNALIPQAPANAGVTPNSGGSGPGIPQLFTSRCTDGNGAGDLSLVYFLMNRSPNGDSALWAYFDPVKNKLYLRNNANTAWLGGYAPGTAAVVSDPAGRGSLNCAETSVSSSGNTLAVNWSLTPKSGWNGTVQNLYLYSRDKEGLEDGWDLMGAWGVSHPPANGTVTPSSGSSHAGTARTLTATYSDPDGAADLSEARIHIGVSLKDSAALEGDYNASTNKLYLRNKANTAWLGGFAPGSSSVISETGGQGSLDCAPIQVSKSGNTLTITWSFTPAATFSGGKNLYLYVKDKANVADGWDQAGTWNVQ
jgi:CSLREA domain-containing protein